MNKQYFVYIMTNIARILYIGVTNDLERRVYEHKMKLVPGFTSRYGLASLVLSFPRRRESSKERKHIMPPKVDSGLRQNDKRGKGGAAYPTTECFAEFALEDSEGLQHDNNHDKKEHKS